MNERLSGKDAGGDPPRRWWGGIATSKLGIGGGYAVGGDALPLAILEHRHGAEVSTTQTHRSFQHRVKYRPELARRGVDDAEHLSGRGLLF